MAKKITWFCDCCGIRVKKREELSTIEVCFSSNEGIQHRDVCFDCWKEYTNGVIEVTKKLFK